MIDVYNRYSDYLKKKYNVKVYKLPISLPVSCPNRELFGHGCSYCGKYGAGFENISSNISVSEQLKQNMEYIKLKYKASKFIAYFQNFTNTYMPLNDFNKYMNEAAEFENIIEIAVSTRPDCITNEYLDILKEIKIKKNINIVIELGLQSFNYHSLLYVNRGHTLAVYIDCVLKIKQYNFEICTHIILNFPWDNMIDVVENAKVLSALKTDYVIIHALYIEKDTQLADEYCKKQFEICSVDEYKERVITFLRFLSPHIVIQRIISRAPKENTLFSNWGESWWKIRDEIETKMNENCYKQGDLFDYLNGKAVKKFL